MEKYRDKIEQHGRTMENMGLTPVAARVYIYLMFHDRPGAVFGEIVDYFKVSKSAVSNALKMLTSAELVEAITIGGQRKRYFSVNFKCTLNEEAMTKKMGVMCDLLRDVKDVQEVGAEFTREIGEAILLYEMLQVEIPIIMERWRKTIALKKEKGD